MELAPRYCRSCGSRILVKNVCHNCNNDPLKGDNYCYDCGALTPNAEECLQCGAKYKTSFPIKPMLSIAGTFAVLVAAAAFFVSRSGNAAQPETASNALPVKEETTNDTIRNNPDTSSMVIAPPKVSDTVRVQPADTASRPPADTTKLNTGIFTPAEARAYNSRCNYFLKNQRSQVMFFVAGGSGFIKSNEKIYELKRRRKGVDVAVFGNDEFEATLRIDGLSGSEKEWLASCTLVIKNNAQQTARQKVYSTCIEL